MFDGCYRLTDLTLHDNRLNYLPDCAFCNLTALTDLYIGYTSNPLFNPITWLPNPLFPANSALRLLSLNNMKLPTLNATVFSSLAQLRDLRLAGNML